MRVRDILEKLPGWFVLPFLVLIFYCSVLWCVAFIPLIFLYGLLLCPMVWIEWAKAGKDVLLIYSDSKHSKEWMERLSPLLANRAVLLNYSERDRWDRWSLPVQLYEIFGPRGIPEQFTEYSLPSAVLFRKLRRPKRLSFGEHSKNCEEKIEILRALLNPEQRG